MYCTQWRHWTQTRGTLLPFMWQSPANTYCQRGTSGRFGTIGRTGDLQWWRKPAFVRWEELWVLWEEVEESKGSIQTSCLELGGLLFRNLLVWLSENVCSSCSLDRGLLPHWYFGYHLGTNRCYIESCDNRDICSMWTFVQRVLLSACKEANRSDCSGVSWPWERAKRINQSRRGKLEGCRNRFSRLRWICRRRFFPSLVKIAHILKERVQSVYESDPFRLYFSTNAFCTSS